MIDYMGIAKRKHKLFGQMMKASSLKKKISSGKEVHFVGIGGTGMSAIAKILIGSGYKISGSDLNSNGLVQRLKAQGAAIYKGHRAGNIKRPDLVIVSSAIAQDNPELREARRKNIPVHSRAWMLGALMKNSEGIAVAGTHGKTTTTSMIGLCFEKAGKDPTILIGGEYNDFGGNAKQGKGKYVIAEADESDGSLLELEPKIAVVTNIEKDHLDFHGTLENIMQTFLAFAHGIKKNGFCVLCADHPNVQKILPRISVRYLTYGIKHGAFVEGKNVNLLPMGSTFDAYRGGKKAGRVILSVPGIHNVYNALAAVTVGLEAGLPMPVLQDALQQFRGVQRRFELKGESGGVTVVDDYGHHPTEICVTLQAARRFWKGRVICVFQPHRYTRTRYLLSEFASCFRDADKLLLTDIYSANEPAIPGLSGRTLFTEVKKENKKADIHYIPRKEDILPYLLKNARKGDLILTVGAGDIVGVGEAFLKTY